MTTSFNPSVNNNTSLQSSWLKQEQPKFGLAPEPAVDAGKPEATVSNFAGLVPSNSNLEAKKLDTAALATTSFQSEPVVAEQAAPEASAATGEGKTVDPNWHSAAPYYPTFAPSYPTFAPYYPAPAVTAKPWTPGPVVGNAHSPWPIASPTPFAGVPNAIAYKPGGHSSEITTDLQWKNFGSPHIGSDLFSAAANLPKHEAGAFLKYASGNESAYNFNPTATTGQIANVLNRDTFGGYGHNSVSGFQDTINRTKDTFNFNRRIAPGTDGIDLAGALALGRDGGANLSTQAIAKWSGTDPWGNPQVISAKEAAAYGLVFQPNGDASISQFVDIARRLEAHSMPITPAYPWQNNSWRSW